ncbi:hypothetical protein V8C37DRAFT_368587 [Trichoderma ceciliae]
MCFSSRPTNLIWLIDLYFLAASCAHFPLLPVLSCFPSRLFGTKTVLCRASPSYARQQRRAAAFWPSDGRVCPFAVLAVFFCV